MANWHYWPAAVMIYSVLVQVLRRRMLNMLSGS